MAQTFNERFEGGTNGTALSTSNTSYTGGIGLSTATAAFDNAVPVLGTLSAKCVQTSAFGSVSLISSNFTATTTQYHRLFAYFDVLPTTSQVYFTESMTSAPAVVTRVGVNSTGKLIINDNGTLVATSTTTLTATTHYRFEMDVVGTSCSVRIYTGASASAAASSTTIVETVSATITGTTFNHFIDGIIGSGNSNLLTWHIDEVVTDNAATPGPASVAATATGSTADGGSGGAAGVATASGSTADGGTATARGAATASGSTADGGTATARGAATSSGSTAVSGAATARGAATASGSTTTTGTASAGIAAVALGGTVTTGLANATYATVKVFRPPLRYNDPPVLPDTPEWQLVPAIYFTDLIPGEVNVFLTNEGVLTEEQPTMWEDVNKVYWGGHENYVTDAEAATIAAFSPEYAARVFTIPAGPGTPPPTGTGSGSTGGSGGTSAPSGNYGDGSYGDGAYGG